MRFSNFLLGVAALVFGCSHSALARNSPVAQQQQPNVEGRHTLGKESGLRLAQPLQPPGSQLLNKESKTACQDIETTEAHVTITVFGTYNGHPEHTPLESECSFLTCPNEQIKEAMQWLFTIVLRSMTRELEEKKAKSEEQSEEDTKTKIEELIGDEKCAIQDDMPEYTASEVPRYLRDKQAPGGESEDQRSPKHRTFFRLKFSKVAAVLAERFVENVCNDYNSDGEELIYGILRALPSPIYPQIAIAQAASQKNPSLKSVVQISTKAVAKGCGWLSQPQRATQGNIAAFFLPACPANAHHVEASAVAPWRCECDVGYHSPGKGIESVGFEDGEASEPYGYRGECVKRQGFCPSHNKDGLLMIQLKSNEPSLGEINDRARAKCPDDSENLDQAQCMVDQTWTSNGQLCRMIPPNPPPIPRCKKPTRPDLEYQNCDDCASTGGSEQCSCRVRCGDGFLQLDQKGEILKPASKFADDPIPCKTQPYNCPVQDSLEWTETAHERCVESSTKNMVPDHCCKQAWGARAPPAKLKSAQCTQIKEDRECFHSQQADGDLQDQPCCWSWRERSSEESALGSCKPRGPETGAGYHCAVTKTVMVAQFDESGFPRCEKKCIDNLSGYLQLEVQGCKDCTVNPEHKCQCEVQCPENKIRWGGGATGNRECNGNDFGTPPFCSHPLSLPNDGKCSRPTDKGMLDINDCDNCKVGKECNCVATCKKGYKNIDSDIPYDTDGVKMSCTEEQANLQDVDCLTHSEREECLSSKSSNAPCCWMRHAEGKPPCAAFGSDIISEEHLPEECASMKTLVLGPLPTCKELCVDIYSEVQDRNNLDPKGCDKCVEGEQDCPCDVKCKQGTERYGGREEGQRSCGPKNAFPAAPLCLPPQQPPVCQQPEVADANPVECAGCVADKPCECKVECLPGFASIPPSVRPVCESEPALLTPASCKELQDRERCLLSKQGDGGDDGALKGSMCCWLSGGFGPAGKPKCAPKGSTLISAKPDACASNVLAKWQSLPVCKQKCKNGLLEAPNIKFLPSLDVCNQCIAGEECDCKVECDKETKYRGGGPPGKRSCTLESLEFAKAPFCAALEETPQACTPPSQDTFKLEDCQEGCTPGKDCQCKISCQKQFVLVGGEDGKRRCQEEPAKLEEVPSCSSIVITDQNDLLIEQCLRSRDSEQRRCCLHGREDDQDRQCAADGSDQVDSPVIMCARRKESRWDPPLPECKPKCENIFAGRAELIVGEGCNSCAIGGENCKCTVRCSDGFERYGGPEQDERWCPEDGKFEGLPVCGKQERAPFCEMSSEMLNTFQGRCPPCEAGSDKCECQVGCNINKGFVREDGDPDKKVHLRCLKKQRPPGEVKCKDMQGHEACVNSLEGAKPCVWQRDFCAVKGSPQITTRPDEENDVAKQFDAEWEGMPACLRKCKHNFYLAENLKVENCNSCHVKMGLQNVVDPEHKHSCPCTVSCAPGHIRYGGGSEGPRSCSEANENFEPPPLCMKPPPVLCQLDKWLRGATNLLQIDDNCYDTCLWRDASSKCVPGFKCNMQCHKDALLVGGEGGTKTCEEKTNHELKTAQCIDIPDGDECLRSKEQIQNRFEPCCYRPDKFSSGTVCAAMASSSIGAFDTFPPSDCAPMTIGHWGGVPLCEERCENIFKEQEHLEYSDGCESCTVSKCDCTVVCTKGWKPRDAETTGTRKCVKLDRKAKFEPPPVCHKYKPCEIPDTPDGTLDVSQCRQKCVPGALDCFCRVTCAEGSVHAGGPREGSSLQCDADGKYTDLPYCIPECQTPPDQYGTLDTTHCPNCRANQNCNCELRCSGEGVHNGGGPQGPYKCVQLPPTQERLTAAAAWAAAEDDKIPPGPLPLCISKIYVEVVSALTHETLEGVELTIYGQSKELVETKTTGPKQKTELDTAETQITLVAKLEGYTDYSLYFDRKINCPNPKQDCGPRLPMSPVLSGGKIVADGCYFVDVPSNAKLQMRAVLSWDREPKDLDIWASSLDCQKDVERRYNCKEKPDCRRDFLNRKVGEDESRSCGINTCWRNRWPNDRVTREDISTGEPDCPNSYTFRYPNQFAKWVLNPTRRLANLDKRIKGIKSKGDTKLEQFVAPKVDTVVLDGFPPNPWCGGRPCDELNAEFVERKEELYSASKRHDYYTVGGLSTYWEHRGRYLILYCKRVKKWCVGSSARLEQYGEGDCPDVWACLDEDVSLFEDNVKFNPLFPQELQAKPYVRFAQRPKGESQWTSDNHIALNVDERSGHGPETITFKNVPPGTYQIAANIWEPPKKDFPDISKGNPRVRIIIGSGKNVEFTCVIDRACNRISRVWSVANIRIVDAGEEHKDNKKTGKRKYFIRVLDSEETMAKLSEFSLHTSEVINPDKDYYKPRPQMNFNDAELNEVCTGRCTAPPGYEQCLEPSPLERGG